MASLLCGCGREKSTLRKKLCDECRIENKKAKARRDAKAHRAKHGSVAKRGIYCSRCKGIKEHQERGYCSACERAIWQERDKPDCATCGKTKENPRDSYCGECKRVKYQIKSAEEGRRYKHHDGRAPTCSMCGAKKEGSHIKESHCAKCNYLVRKKRLPFRNDEQLFKASARRITYLAKKCGILIPQSCEVCETDKDVHAHHDDYSKPLDVRWLCRKHHNEHHKQQ